MSQPCAFFSPSVSSFHDMAILRQLTPRCTIRANCESGAPMINGAHIVIYSKNPEIDRTFFRDVLHFPSVDAGHGWLVFEMPPLEAAFHDAESTDRHELY